MEDMGENCGQRRPFREAGPRAHRFQASSEVWADQSTAPALRDASTDAFRVSMLTVAGLVVAGAAVGATAIADREVRSDAADASA
jgi:hypothetical protein